MVDVGRIRGGSHVPWNATRRTLKLQEGRVSENDVEEANATMKAARLIHHGHSEEVQQNRNDHRLHSPRILVGHDYKVRACLLDSLDHLVHDDNLQ